jgi:hypothetical protein
MGVTFCKHPLSHFCLTFYLTILRHAYRGGVTRAITAPSGDGFIQGLSTKFFSGAESALDSRAILQEDIALHVTLSHSVHASISTQIATLRELLFESNTTAWQRVRSVSHCGSAHRI